tara:strand:+ start:7794 stop:8141 length:348 start_codon:yes stop_codon:yes gene_type:complete
MMKLSKDRLKEIIIEEINKLDVNEAQDKDKSSVKQLKGHRAWDFFFDRMKKFKVDDVIEITQAISAIMQELGMGLEDFQKAIPLIKRDLKGDAAETEAPPEEESSKVQVGEPDDL